jgi:hypothetical protein
MEVSNSPFARSSIGNGRTHRRLTVDGRGYAARRWREVHRALLAELGHEPSIAEGMLIRSACDLTLAQEALSTEVASGRTIDTGELNRISFSLRRTLAELGMTGKGAAEPAGPSLADLLAEHARGGGT